VNNEFPASKDSRILVTGAGGFIGGWLVKNLIEQNYINIRAVDIKPKEEWHQRFDSIENLEIDLQGFDESKSVMRDVGAVYNLAADMGGMGFIENNKSSCMLSVLINTNLLRAATLFEVTRFFFASSACIYNTFKQQSPDNQGLKEEDAYPAFPEDGYGWEKLFSERMCQNFSEDFKIETRIGRYHNVYGPKGTFIGGREKAPAAICRKVAQAKMTGIHEIEIWGDGNQTRSFTYVDDIVYGTQLLLHSDIKTPINLGSSEMVSINQLVDLVEELAGIKLIRNYNLQAPKGVRGRNSDNSLIKEKLNWEPAIPLIEGLSKTYEWVYNQMKSEGA
jgi:nucleoside-diphosphate-sugar epimerase